MARRLIEAVLTGAAVFAGAWLFEQLRSPYSDVRLRLDELVDQLKGATP